MDKKVYDIQGVKCEIRPVTWGQIEDIGKLADEWQVDLSFALPKDADADAKKAAVDARLSDLIGKAMGKMGELFSILFPNVDFSDVDWRQVTLEETVEILEVFFTSTPRLRAISRKLFGFLQ